MNTIKDLQDKSLKELYSTAVELGIKNYSKMNKKELMFAILKGNAEKDNLFFVEGVLEIVQSGDFGFLRPINYSGSLEDVYVSASQITRFGLRNGDKVSGRARPAAAVCGSLIQWM